MEFIRPATFSSLKRKRSGSVSSSRSYSATPLPADTINPFSYPPSLLRQFAIAGLTDKDVLPSSPNFPHRPLPPDNSTQPVPDADADEVTPKRNTSSYGPSASLPKTEAQKNQKNADRARRAYERHIGPLRAIVLRSLQRGDIVRAKRAFGIVVRAKVDGKPVDLRQDQWWAIGAEILMREGEVYVPQPEPSTRDGKSGDAEGQEGVDEDVRMDDDEEYDPDAERGDDAAEYDPDPEGADVPAVETHSEDKPKVPSYRWGTAQNATRVQSYYQTLIQLFPYDRLRPGRVDALTFWPVMVGVEVYDIHVETAAAFARAEAEAETWSDTDEPMEPFSAPERYHQSDYDPDSGDSDGSDRSRPYLEPKEARLRARKETIRLLALDAIRNIARRMDLVMEGAPFSTSHEMLRLRGMVALYAGDLAMPTVPRSRREEREGSLKREEERNRARERFGRVIRANGEVEAWVEAFTKGRSLDAVQGVDRKGKGVDRRLFPSVPRL